MAMKLYSDSDIQDIADAIRAKNGLATTYKVSEMAQAIADLPSGGGGSGLGWFTKSASGTVTYASSNNNNTSLKIFDLADIDFTPKTVLCRIQPASLKILKEAYEDGTLTVGKWAFCSYNLLTTTDGDQYHIRSTSRVTVSNNAMTHTVANGNALTWNTLTGDWIYNNGTAVYFRTTSGYGAYAGTTYDWIALGD